jgi:hypothetical protein
MQRGRDSTIHEQRRVFRPGRGLTAGLEGIDNAVLRVEARFFYAKRMGEDRGGATQAPELLASSSDAFVRAFVDSCPPTTLSRLENACQFYRFPP